MAAFEKILSGIPEMDTALDYIRLGDNVVWQVTNLDEFKLFVKPYVTQALHDKRNIIYIRFSEHEPLIEENENIKVEYVELSHRFETFTVEIHNIIEREGFDAFYVFDCLSELQTAWATDLMMGNFFRVTCPFLFKLDTVAYFPLIRGKHSFEAIAKIRDTAQLFLDVYSTDTSTYVRPAKVWNRYSDTMFLPHLYDKKKGSFSCLMDGVDISRFYEVLNTSQDYREDLNTDSWDRFFLKTRQKYASGEDTTEECSRMCNIMMTRDEKMRTMVKANFKAQDYFRIRSRMIGTGMIGGKACGMLLARKLVENNRPDIFARFEPHDSYYVGSDVFYSYIVYNDLWELRVRQRKPEEYFSLADEFAEGLKQGEFPGTIKEEFRRMLDYYGQNPIIVRSSSILEDGFGNAFAGKYESVFCINYGTLPERLKEFEAAVKTVYASTMSKSALDYRLRRGLAARDEQMSLLVQRVSGSRYEHFFMPCAAGVGYSYSPYKFSEKMDQTAGMLRLVMGLGTGAVDRTQGSYPRLVSLDMPEATSATTSAEKHQYSQRNVDVIDIAEGEVIGRPFSVIEKEIPEYLKKLTLEHDYDAERRFRDRGQRRDIMFISCLGLVKNKALMKDMKDMMALIQSIYDYSVDIEYTINLSEKGEYVINLLQCRPLQVAKDTENITIPENIPEENILLLCNHASMGLSMNFKLDYIIYVDPVAYYNMPYNDKSKIATAIGNINWSMRGKNKKILLLVPGRVGTSSPELGVPTTFSDISEFDAVCEISESKAGYMPELSYGSHIFQDLVEAGILYTAIFENEKTKTYAPEKLKDLKNIFVDIYPENDKIKDIVYLYDVSENDIYVYHDMHKEEILIARRPIWE